MKKALVIVAAVTGYVVIETLVLLTVILPHKWYLPGIYQTFALWAQFLLIPGLAALFSRIIYGPRKWARRVLVILLVGPLGLSILMAPFSILAILLDWTFIVSKILFAAAMSIVFGAMIVGFRWCMRRLRRWNAESEADEWLAERRAATGTHRRKWCSRGIRFASCIPAMTVLLVFLFLPEIWGALSHVTHRRLGKLPGYQVRIPSTWLVLSQEEVESDGSAWIEGLVGRGIGLGGNPFRYDSLSGWEVRTNSFNLSDTTGYDRFAPKPEEIISRRVLTTENEQMECLDYLRSYLWASGRPEAGMIAHVQCSSTGRLRASFDGERSELPTFYRMLEEVKRSQ